MYQDRYSWAQQPEKVDEALIEKELYTDIVVIGAGQSGTAAARSATENGSAVIVIEQQPEEHQWILGMGEYGCFNSKWQLEHGAPEVDIDEFVNDWQLRSGNRSNYRLIRKYAERCGDWFDWFIEPLSEDEKMQIHLMQIPYDEHFPWILNGLHSWPGTAELGVKLQDYTIKLNQKEAQKNGAKFLFSTRALYLLNEDGRVRGAVVQDKDGRYVRIHAGKGVILAAGDYSKNQEMCDDLLIEARDLVDEGNWYGHGWDGSGIRMGMWAGARLEPRSHGAMGGNYSFPGFDLIGSTAVLRVNSQGKRYSNEGFGTHILAARPGVLQPNGMLWGVFDSHIREEIRYQAANHAEFDYANEAELERLEVSLKKLEENRNNKTAINDKAGDTRMSVCADTLEELSALMFDELSARKQFLETVKRYNELAENKSDSDFGKDANLLHPIIEGPFYACSNRKDSHHPGGQSLKLLVTVSGLLIDENQCVLDCDFLPIKGLLATGNCSGCRFGSAYTTSLPGQSLSIAGTMGREAGIYLSKQG